MARRKITLSPRTVGIATGVLVLVATAAPAALIGQALRGGTFLLSNNGSVITWRHASTAHRADLARGESHAAPLASAHGHGHGRLAAFGAGDLIDRDLSEAIAQVFPAILGAPMRGGSSAMTGSVASNGFPPPPSTSRDSSPEGSPGARTGFGNDAAVSGLAGDDHANVADLARDGASAAAAASVPEPGTWALLVAGFGLVGLMTRRRTRSATTFARA